MSDKLPIVYVGPTSPRLGLVRFAHYTELNKNIQAAIAKHPALNVLFIPLEQFGTRAAAVYAGQDASIVHAAEHLSRGGIL